MKSLLFIFTFIFYTLIFSSPSYARWEKVDERENGDTFYVDFERMRKVDGYVYFWDLLDHLKPTEYGDLSSEVYKQGDCKLFRYKGLSWSFHKEPMGGGTGEVNNDPDKEWKYPPPNSAGETIIKSVCSR